MDHFKRTFVHSKCKRSSLRSQLRDFTVQKLSNPLFCSVNPHNKLSYETDVSMANISTELNQYVGSLEGRNYQITRDF